MTDLTLDGYGGEKTRTFKLGRLLVIIVFLSLISAVVVDVANNNPRSVAVVDDDITLMDGIADALSMYLMPGDFNTFENCGQLLAVMDSGIRYNIYVVDTDPAPGHLDGFACAGEILARHPGARIIAASGVMNAARKERYREIGVTEFLEKPTAYVRWFMSFGG